MPTVEVNNLIKNYGSFQAVKGISFEINEGEIFGLIGPNGAGKTTTLRVISTLLQINSGNVKIFEFDLKTPKYRKSVPNKAPGIGGKDVDIQGELGVNIDFHILENKAELKLYGKIGGDFCDSPFSFEASVTGKAEFEGFEMQKFELIIGFKLNYDFSPGEDKEIILAIRVGDCKKMFKKTIKIVGK